MNFDLDWFFQNLPWKGGTGGTSYGREGLEANENRLKNILSLRRFQALEHLHLQTPLLSIPPYPPEDLTDTRFEYVIEDAEHHLQIARSYPSLSWDAQFSERNSRNSILGRNETYATLQMSKVAAFAKLAEVLVKFDEVDLTALSIEMNSCSQLLMSLTSASDGESSKLKKLSIFESAYSNLMKQKGVSDRYYSDLSDALAEARERFAVNIVDYVG